jgi:hypothetical protein
MGYPNISKIRNTAVVLAALCLLGACSNQPNYVIDQKESFDFSPFKTYRWYDDVNSSTEGEFRRHNSSDKRIRSYMDRELTAKGLRETRANDTGDFLVNYHISKQEHTRINNYSGYPQGMHSAVGLGTYGSAVAVGYSSGPSVKVFKEGTVVIDVIDTKSNKLVWRGIAEGRMKSTLSQKDKDHIASEISRELLTDFPPASASK